MKDIHSGKYLLHMISPAVGNTSGFLNRLEKILEDQAPEVLGLKAHEKSKFNVRDIISSMKKDVERHKKAIEVMRFIQDDGNIFDLYEKDPEVMYDATQYIIGLIKSGELTEDNLDDGLLEEYRKIGATDTASKDQIWLYIRGEHDCQKQTT